jgi:DNA-binding CsgD family transcriptional regulator
MSDSTLRLLGVSAEAEALWRALLDRPVESFAELTKITLATPDETRRRIDALLEMGLVRPANGAGFAATDPSLSVEAHLLRAERRLAEEAESLAAIRALVPAFASEYRNARSSDVANLPTFDVVRPLSEIRNELARAAEQCKREIRSVDPGNGTAAAELEAIDASRESLLKALERGVVDRTIIAESTLADVGVFVAYEDLYAWGGRLRMLTDVPCRLTVFDRSVAFLALDPRNGNFGAIVTRVPSLIDALVFMFDQIWVGAISVFSVPVGDGFPSPRGARIIELMAAGMKDERIARALGVGARTIRRDIADLKDLFGVSSRTEIVAAAAKRAWI